MKDVIVHSSFTATLQNAATRKKACFPGKWIGGLSLLPFLLVQPTASASEVDPTKTEVVPVETPTAPACLKYDRYNHKGSESPFPSNCESISPELGGLRNAMYEAGWNTQLILTTGVLYDLKHHDGGKQMYSGQKPSSASTASLLVTHDLGRYGLPEGSLFTLGGSGSYYSYDGDGPREAYISQLSARIPFYDDRVVVQFGYFSLASQFYGTLLGNNIAASTLGPASGFLAQTGAQGFKPSPGLDIRLYSEDKKFYNHFGVARSISPHGIFADSDDNRLGLEFNTTDAKSILINEVGYRVEAGPDNKKVWLRGGVVYNDSNYTRLDDPNKTNKNYGSYLVGDVQLTQPDKTLPYKGWYVNAYANQSRENVNGGPGAFGGSLYSLGPFDSRPYDLFAIGFARNQYSSWARKNAAAAGIDYAEATDSITLSYAYRVMRGIYVQTALIHNDNPTFAPKLDSSLSANATLVLVF